jgi:hypothetical protein
MKFDSRIGFRLIQSLKVSTKSQSFIDLEYAKSAHNYHPIPVVINRGLGIHVWDVDDKVLKRIYFSIFQIQIVVMTNFIEVFRFSLCIFSS